MSSTAAVAKLPRSTPVGRVTQARVFRSELTKLTSLRSTRYTLLATAVVTVGFGVLVSAVVSSHWSTMSASSRASFDPLSSSLLGVNFGLLTVGILGVLLMTGEYTTGMVRSTFTAVPTRLPVLWAKLGAYGLVVLVVAVPSTLIAFFAGQALLTHDHIQIAFSHSGVPGAVLGSALLLALVGVFGLGLGSIMRNTAAGIASFVAIMFVIPPLVTVLPSNISNSITPYLPTNAGTAILKIGYHAHTLSPWAGMAVFAAWAAAAVAVAGVLLVRRDV